MSLDHRRFPFTDKRTDEPLPGPDWLLHWRRTRLLWEEIRDAYDGVEEVPSIGRDLRLTMIYA